MITRSEYLMGRAEMFPEAFTETIARNADRTVTAVNDLLEIMAAAGVEPQPDNVGRLISSGWRPAQVNERTHGAAEHSRHISAEACDLHDWPDRRLCRWALRHQEHLKQCGIAAMENPQWTPTWLHVQIVPVPSGNFVFRPSMDPPLADPLPEQGGTA